MKQCNNVGHNFSLFAALAASLTFGNPAQAVGRSSHFNDPAPIATEAAKYTFEHGDEFKAILQAVCQGEDPPEVCNVAWDGGVPERNAIVVCDISDGDPLCSFVEEEGLYSIAWNNDGQLQRFTADELTYNLENEILEVIDEQDLIGQLERYLSDHLSASATPKSWMRSTKELSSGTLTVVLLNGDAVVSIETPILGAWQDLQDSMDAGSFVWGECNCMTY